MEFVNYRNRLDLVVGFAPAGASVGCGVCTMLILPIALYKKARLVAIAGEVAEGAHQLPSKMLRIMA